MNRRGGRAAAIGSARAIAAAAALAVVGAAPSASASPEDIFGYGPRSAAMGTVGVAAASDYEAAYTNPALLSLLRRRRLSLGLTGGSFDLRASGPGLPGHVPYDASKGILIGADLPVPFVGALRDRVGIGVAMYTPRDVIVRGRILYPETPQYPLLPDRAQSVTLRLGVGADLGYGVRVGAGFAALAEITGSAVVATDATGRVGTRVEDQLVATYAPTLGLAYDLRLDVPGKVRVGASYRGALSARFAVTIDATQLSTLKLPLLDIAGLAQYDPAQLALEVAHVGAHHTIALGAGYKRWSAYPGPLEPTVSCPAAMPDCSALSPPKIDYRDTFALRAGAEVAVAEYERVTLRVRAGAFFETSPLPKSLPTSGAYDMGQGMTAPVPTRYFDAPRLAGTAGVGADFGALTIDTFAQIQTLMPTTFTTAGADGASSPLGRASGSIVAGGLVVGVRF